jgi:DNA-binding response OmpR family regulator
MKPRVLFIEDDFNQAVLYKTKFQLEGFEFLRAENGKEGLAMAREKNPDLIFLDILLPDESGIEVMKRLKADEKTKVIPTAFLTNLSDRISHDEGVGMGAVDYFVKTNISLKDLVAWAKTHATSPQPSSARGKKKT